MDYKFLNRVDGLGGIKLKMTANNMQSLGDEHIRSTLITKIKREILKNITKKISKDPNKEFLFMEDMDLNTSHDSTLIIYDTIKKYNNKFILTNGNIASNLQDVSGFTIDKDILVKSDSIAGSIYYTGMLYGKPLFVDPNMSWLDTRIILFDSVDFDITKGFEQQEIKNYTMSCEYGISVSDKSNVIYVIDERDGSFFENEIKFFNRKKTIKKILKSK